jgi:sialidase-1
LRLGLPELTVLDEAAFETGALAFDGSYSICFWFFTPRFSGTSVIANQGNQHASQAGWSVTLRDAELVLRVNPDHKHGLEVSATLSGPDSWHHFAGVVDPEQGKLEIYLDGSPISGRVSEVREVVEASSVVEEPKLLIGGYTDAAGGHFDHTFGRSGTGFVDDFRLYGRALEPAEIASFITRGTETPIASFRLEPELVEAPVTVEFEAISRGEADTAYLWDFGDGSRGAGARIEHSYRYAGDYRVRLRVVDDHHAQAVTERIVYVGGEADPLEITPVFVNGSEGYACFRIPAIVRAVNGDLVAFAEGRVAGCSDSTPVIHIVCKRSTDGGRSWQPLQVVARNFMAGREHACMNPAPVVDELRGTGRIAVVFNKLEYSEWRIVKGEGMNRVSCIFSDDHGKSWHDERDITLQVHRPYNPSYASIYPGAARPEHKDADWRKQVPTLGHAIQLRGTPENPVISGRFFFIGSRTRGDESVFHTQNYAFWSDDLGESWQLGPAIERREDGSSAKGLNEAAAAELPDGSVLVCSRNYQQGALVGRRAVTRGTFDRAGKLHFGAVRHDPALIDSGVQASLLSLAAGDEVDSGRHRLLFANPAHPKARLGMTVRLSFDGGESWPLHRLIDPGPAAYSDLCQTGGSVGLLYERGNRGGIAFVRLTLSWLEEESQGRRGAAPLA